MTTILSIQAFGASTRLGLSPAARLVVLVLAERSSRHDGDATTIASEKYLSEATGLSVGAVKRAVKELVEAGLITRRRRADASSVTTLRVGLIGGLDAEYRAVLKEWSAENRREKARREHRVLDKKLEAEALSVASRWLAVLGPGKQPTDKDVEVTADALAAGAHPDEIVGRIAGTYVSPTSRAAQHPAPTIAAARSRLRTCAATHFNRREALAPDRSYGQDSDRTYGRDQARVRTEEEPSVGSESAPLSPSVDLHPDPPPSAGKSDSEGGANTWAPSRAPDHRSASAPLEAARQWMAAAELSSVEPKSDEIVATAEALEAGFTADQLEQLMTRSFEGARNVRRVAVARVRRAAKEGLDSAWANDQLRATSSAAHPELFEASEESSRLDDETISCGASGITAARLRLARALDE